MSKVYVVVVRDAQYNQAPELDQVFKNRAEAEEYALSCQQEEAYHVYLKHLNELASAHQYAEGPYDYINKIKEFSERHGWDLYYTFLTWPTKWYNVIEKELV